MGKDESGTNSCGQLVLRRESWKALGSLDQEVAKQQYLECVQDLFEEFDVHGPKTWRSSLISPSNVANKTMALCDHISMAGAVSMPEVNMYVPSPQWYFGLPRLIKLGMCRLLYGTSLYRSTDEWKVKDDVFHYASTGNLDKLLPALDQGEDINTQVSMYLLGHCKCRSLFYH